MEVGLEAVQLRPGAEVRADRGIALKGAPEAARLSTLAGEAALLNVALARTPQRRVPPFGAALANNNRREFFGGTQATLGARGWLVRDRFGLDLTASRQAGARPGDGATRSPGLGLGWYGLGG